MKIRIQRSKKTVSEITLKECNGSYEIHYIRTEPEHRGRGYASMLIERAKAKCGSLVALIDGDGSGLTYEQMEVWYKRHGFKRIRFDFGTPWNKNIKTAMYWVEKTGGAQ